MHESQYLYLKGQFQANEIIFELKRESVCVSEREREKKRKIERKETIKKER